MSGNLFHVYTVRHIIIAYETTINQNSVVQWDQLPDFRKRHSENEKSLKNRQRNGWKTQTRLERGPIVVTYTRTYFEICFDEMMSYIPS